jgi:hypothetical protein
MIKASLNPETDRVEIYVSADGQQLQREYIGIIATIIRQFRLNGVSDELIEKNLIESIVDGFNNLDDN